MPRVAKRLIDLLDAERKAILAGDLSAAVGLTERKEALVAKPESDNPDAEAVQAIRSRATRNAALLAAALKGAQAAREKVAAILSAKPLRTYGSDGRSMTLDQGDGGFERRA